jgi:hypothetical protein
MIFEPDIWIFAEEDDGKRAGGKRDVTNFPEHRRAKFISPVFSKELKTSSLSSQITNSLTN